MRLVPLENPTKKYLKNTQKYKKLKISCTIIEQPRAERTLYLVQTGRFETKEQAVDFAANKLVPLKIEYQPLLKR